MTEQPTRDQIIEGFQRQMIAALEGRLVMQEVCGLSIESLRTSLIAERDSLLKQYGYADSTNRESMVSSNPVNKENGR